MVRRNRRTGRNSDGARMDAFFAKIGLVGKLIVLIVGAFIIFLSNVFSSSTISDFGWSVWRSNIAGFHVDSVMQARTDLRVFVEPNLILVPDRYHSTIPNGALFRHRGTIRLENVHWLAVDFFHQAERRTGFLLVELRRRTDPNTGRQTILPYQGMREIRYSESSRSYPVRSRFVNFSPAESDRGVLDSVMRSIVEPLKRADLVELLNIRYASTPIDRERILSSDEFTVIDLLSTDHRIAYVDDSEAAKYQRIVDAFNQRALQMLIYQTDVDFDALDYMRDQYRN